ncbi:hypothetical protein B0H67DRAFT_606697 [Lasiosphaeris hirsuta]|uniref:LysM domain-containing protein n=1 Tax=Lasiosphaeris hirsuta TaxID=260670 RepID=A0AA40EBJ1_9PEZI|nr:hypothetical protein B0H67DRAFT_606697 [Lasiosphaeris hirsuta]
MSIRLKHPSAILHHQSHQPQQPSDALTSYYYSISNTRTTARMMFINLLAFALAATGISGLATPLVEGDSPDTLQARACAPTKPADLPIQPGAISGCCKWHAVVAGDTCWGIQQKYKLSDAQFSDLNTKVGHGDACVVWKDYYVCVGK